MRNGRVVLCHADIGEILHLFFAGKSVKVRVDKGAGQFSGAVRAEVAEDDTVAVLYGQCGDSAGDIRLCSLGASSGLCTRRACSIASGAKGRLDKLIGFAAIIGGLHSSLRISRLPAAAACQGIVSKLHTIPALVAVHRVITT